MKYKILISDKPLSEEQYRRLSKLNVLIPFDPSCLKYNIYIYVPSQDKDLLKKVKESLSCKDYGMEVTEQEVQKHMDKVKKIYAFNVGDTVLYRTKFKNLPFIVASINETKATIQCCLRTLTFEVEVDVGLLYTPPQDSTTNINLPVMQAVESMLVVDFNTQFDWDDSDIHSNFIDMLRTLLIIKTLFPKKRIVFSNPDDINAYLGSILGFTLVYGCIGSYINNRPCTFLTDSAHNFIYTNEIIFTNNLHKITTKKEWEIANQTTAETAYSYACLRPKYPYEVHNKEASLIVGEHTYLSTLTNIDLVAIKTLLNESNGYKYLFTIEKQLRILNG